jgi:antagonist of KipI
MSAIRVIEPGLFTTVQDLGREGYGPMGVSPSGAADAISLRLGNRLVGNAEGAAGLEMTLMGGTFAFPNGAVVALAGSDFGATLDGKKIKMWTPFQVKSGQVLRMGPTRSGARCYLCVRGGIDVRPFLGSASTHILSGLGGHEGRALRKGDVLNIGVGQAFLPVSSCPSTPAAEGAGKRKPFQQRRLPRLALKKMQPRKVLRVTPGPQSDWFRESGQKIFYESTYRVAEESNRMGIRLEGAAILTVPSSAGEEQTGKNACPTGIAGEMISEGVSLGAIQVPEGGQPIILFVEQQTTGGYPKIANVISADFHSLGQLRPRDEIRFERVEWERARALLKDQEELMASHELIVEG